ncbi:MAG: glycosyltransferase family 4 protein [Syntrophobacteraceae bacterium]
MSNINNHILLIHQAFVGPNEPGGTRHYEFAKHCVANGHRFSVIASDLSYLTGEPTLHATGLVEVQNLDGVRVLRAYTYPSLHRSFVWRVVSFISFMLTSIYASLRAGRVDMVMGTSPPIFQAVSAWVVSRLRRRPLLLEIRDLWPEFAIDMGVLKNPLLIWVSRKLEIFLYTQAKHLLVNSPAYRDYLVSKGVPPAKITLIPNGVDAGMFDPLIRGNELPKLWGDKGKFLVTYAGALGMANDIPTLLRAAALLSDDSRIHFILLGDGKERDNLEVMARGLDLTNVTFGGAIPKSRVPEALAASDACLAILKDIPMFRTTYPNKVFDYMAAGRPTILLIDGVIRDVVESANAGIFVPPGDEVALAEAVRKLSRNRKKARAMGKAARAYVVEHFDRRKHADQFVELIRRIAYHEI